MGLAFLPLAQIEPTFDSIVDDMPLLLLQRLQPLLTYFRKQWLQRIPPDHWCVSGATTRSNNDIEG